MNTDHDIAENHLIDNTFELLKSCPRTLLQARF